MGKTRNAKQDCQIPESRYKHPRLVGYWQNNGKAKGYKRYRRYRCRECNLGIRQESLHGQVSEELSRLLLTQPQREKLKERARKIWASYETELIEKARIELGRLQILKDRKAKIMDSYVTETDLAMKQEIRAKVEDINAQIVEAEKKATEAQDFEKDFDEFICYAFDTMDGLKDKWWQLDKKTMRLYKQLLFPAGIQLLPDKKVYIREVSPIYSYENQKNAPK